MSLDDINKEKAYLLSHPELSASTDFSKRFGCFRRKIYCLIGALVIGVIILIILLVSSSPLQVQNQLDPPDVSKPSPPSNSPLRKFSKAAVVTNSAPCADIAKSILKQGGNAVDAMIGAMLCDGIVMPQSLGIGGGFFMVIYDKKQNKTYTINAREAAPLAAKLDMYKENPDLSKYGPLAIAVPGEMNGYWTAYKNFGGGVPWRNIIYPAIKLCEEGIPVNTHLVRSLNLSKEMIQNYETLKKLFTNSTTGEFVKVGDMYKNLQLAKTLRVIAEEGGHVLYTGSLASLLVSDIQKAGGIITNEDLSNYVAIIEEPIVSSIFGKYKLHTVAPPASGIVLSFILRMLKDLIPASSDILNTQRITEAFKYAFGMRSQLGDPHFTNISKLMDWIASDNNVDKISRMISDTRTWNNADHYGGSYIPVDHGTASLSIITENGDAVCTTNTVNLLFGSLVVSPSTGIILNSQMDDFSHPYAVNEFFVPPSEANFIFPSKRPLSSVCPSIIIDSDGNVRLVIGAAGGTHITTSVALTIMRLLLFGKNIKESIDSPMFHHQLLPMVWQYEYATLKMIVDGMQKIGHKVAQSEDSVYSCINALEKKDNILFANSDYRREGSIAGY